MFGRKKTDKLIQAEIEVLRRSLENSLYTQSALERSRADIMRLFEKPRLSAPVPEKMWEIGMSDKPFANE